MEECEKQIYQVEFLDINEISIKEKERIRTTSGIKVEDLKESINDIGLFHPIIVNKNNKLVAGYRRLNACRQLGWESIPAFIRMDVDELDEIKIELQENLRRKNLSPYEVDIGLAKMKKIYERIHPETVHLAHNKKRIQKKEKIQNNETNTLYGFINEEFVQESENFKRAKRFTRVASESFNYSERTIRDKIQVGNAILNKNYDYKTISSYKNGEISHFKMLEKDRNRRIKEKSRTIKSRSKQNEFEIKWCKDCKKAKISPCPDCGKQIIICINGSLVTKNIDSIRCKDYC